MPALDFSSTFITILIAVLSAGITWGAMRSTNKTTEARMHETIKELKDLVNDLKGISSDLQVTKVTTSDNKADIADHEKRIIHLEIAVAKLQVQP